MPLFMGDLSLDNSSSLKKLHGQHDAMSKETEGGILELAEGGLHVDIEPQPP